MKDVRSIPPDDPKASIRAEFCAEGKSARFPNNIHIRVGKGQALKRG
ncbi:hypothetical protein LEP1GSC193_2901 [Leptospira alstonii serovar Pingchang str. 80-412]|uniref:Uncharacterized protein n=2 Tax=Leptospira alstonii TaxID=28452 RepID=M6CXE5_9LEPT|nr:hypothetical protein LEP1GSC194_3263 [Leptospira alstonii serovar Sichuan str. 79601]EQA81761.1 hypothetical protein LEP1GSC193_2901 [Leptospira alstonii serovar Pingchang str. 80-412]